ncbi:hypothetical protein CCACVL1_07683, partial [Corchorus capsularis]
ALLGFKAIYPHGKYKIKILLIFQAPRSEARG